MFDRCLYFNLNSLTRELNKQWDDEFAKLDLSAPQGYFLRLALERPGSNQKDLAERMNLATSTLTRFVDALEKKGLLKRIGCPNDARAIVIQPTKKAQALEHGIDQAMNRLGKHLAETIGEKDVSELLRILRICQDRIQGAAPNSLKGDSQ